MQTALVALALATLLAWLAFVADVLHGRHGLVWLESVSPPQAGARLPTVSVVVAARNEEAHVEAGVRSLLALEYPHLEVVAVDDRSEDRTGRILASLAAGDSRLRVLRVDELPAGWLGKNHALQLGADAADGDLLLFTDADVRFAPTVVARAVAHLEAAELDHLAAAAAVDTPGPGLALFMSTFALLFNAWFRPWRAADPDSEAYVGTGAFNLVRARAYRRIDGHRSVAFDPVDDVHLGRELKRSGARQQCALAGSLLRIEWYPSLAAAVRGLEKNTLAAADWSVLRLAAGGLAQVVLVVWPFVATLTTSGTVQRLNLVAAGLILAIQLAVVVAARLPAWTAPALPLGVLLMQFVCARAAILTWWRGGIRWRGTFYSLGELRGWRDRER